MSQELAAVQPNGVALLDVIRELATDERVQVSKIAELVALQERAEARRAEREFNAAMQSAQAEMMPIVRDAQNSHTQSRYARLETIDAKIRPVYTAHGFSLSFNSAEPIKQGAVKVVCRVRHIGGHSETHELEGDLDLAGAKGTSNKTSIQGLGSTVSYLRRYLTMMIFNLALINEDDDGNAAAAISPDQAQMIKDWLVLCKVEPDSERMKKFLHLAEAGCVEEIRRRDYQRVMATLRGERRKMQQETAE